MRTATITIIGILTLGWVLATLEPPHWMFGEILLAAACMMEVREYLYAREQSPKSRGASERILAGNNAWFADTEDIDGYTRVYHPWDSERQAAKKRKIAVVPGEPIRFWHSHKQSAEQLAHEMLMQAFRHASSAHGRGGDPDEMRRVSAARDLLLRAIQKP